MAGTPLLRALPRSSHAEPCRAGVSFLKNFFLGFRFDARRHDALRDATLATTADGGREFQCCCAQAHPRSGGTRRRDEYPLEVKAYGLVWTLVRHNTARTSDTASASPVSEPNL